MCLHLQYLTQFYSLTKNIYLQVLLLYRYVVETCDVVNGAKKAPVRQFAFKLYVYKKQKHKLPVMGHA